MEQSIDASAGAAIVVASVTNVVQAEMIEVTVTGTISTPPESPYGLSYDSSVFVGQSFTYVFTYDANTVGTITYETRYGVAGATGIYAFGSPTFGATTAFGNYTGQSTAGQATVINDRVFSPGDEEDDLSISSTGAISSSNPLSPQLNYLYTSIGLYDYSHTVFSSAALPSLSTYEMSNYPNGGIADFLAYNDSPFQNVFMQGTVQTLTARIVPESSTLVLLGIGAVSFFACPWRQHKRTV